MERHLAAALPDDNVEFAAFKSVGGYSFGSHLGFRPETVAFRLFAVDVLDGAQFVIVTVYDDMSFRVHVVKYFAFGLQYAIP